MTAPTIPIVGVPLVPGQKLPVRQEITAWYTNPDNKYQVSLFMQALTKLENIDYHETLSFFQIAGIHCYPLVEWDGVAPHRQPTTDPNTGFCAHNLITFPAWHRPYIILFEQALQALMNPLIKSWSLSDEDARPWYEASSTFRLPYWDWASKQPYTNNFAIPEVCTLTDVTVVMPQNKTQTIPNPLAKFSNPTGKSMGDPSMGKDRIKNDGELPWSECIGTSRYGIFGDQPASKWAEGVNGWQSANTAIASPPWYAKGGLSSFGDAVSRMLSDGYFSSYEQFASTEYNNANSATDFFSLEYIHNNIHNATGGQFMTKAESKGQPAQPIGVGHMSDVPVAAFDPIFFLHHCNVDRLFAIWQTLNPKMWFSNMTPNPTDPKSTDPLLPFHYNSTGGFWTPDFGRDWTKFNFQYNDLVPQPDAINPDGTINQEQYLKDVRNHVNTLYPNTSQIVKATPSLAEPGNKFNDYIINVVYDRYALGGRAYNILFFLGEPPADITEYPHHENFLGQVYTFSAPIEIDGAVACQNCLQQQGDKIRSTAHIPITVPLLYKATKQSEWHQAGASGQAPLGVPDAITGPLEPQIVARIAEQSLRMVFVELGGQVHDNSEFPDTEVALMQGRGQHAVEADGLPTYSGYKVLYKIMLDAGGNHWARLGEDARSRGIIQNDADAE